MFDDVVTEKHADRQDVLHHTATVHCAQTAGMFAAFVRHQNWK